MKELFESEKYKSYLNTMSKFHNYSANNIQLIAMQRPDATFVAGYRAWQNNFERHVNRGEKGIRILALAPYKIKEEQEKVDPVTNEPMLALVYSVTQNIINNLSVSLSQFASIDELFIYLKDWNDFLELEEENNAHKLTSNFDINFKNVYFNYPNQELKVINGLNLSIPYGEKVVIVGENGSGKSTLISLLLGMYALNTGEIFIGKENINNVLYYYRKNISCMFQNYLKLQLSVRDNINIGNLDSDIVINNDIIDFLSDLPEGLDTILGQLDNCGRELSGGQWQKLAIQRALERKQAKILILDEPTSNLDIKTEKKIFKYICDKFSKSTIILVTHKMELCKYFDRVIVMKDGKIVEDGSYEILIQKKGFFHEMYMKQNLN